LYADHNLSANARSHISQPNDLVCGFRKARHKNNNMIFFAPISVGDFISVVK
jgi:hypothetical protein